MSTAYFAPGRAETWTHSSGVDGASISELKKPTRRGAGIKRATAEEGRLDFDEEDQ